MLEVTKQVGVDQEPQELVELGSTPKIMSR